MARRTILLVDDTRLFLELEKEFLKHSAVNIMTAATGREALDLARVTKPDLVYLDLHMPEMDGAACCSALKADPDFRSVPVVMVITAGRQDDLDRCRAAGCDALVSKPIDRRIFLDTGRRFLPDIDRREGRMRCRTLIVFQANGEPGYGTSEDLSTQGLYIATAFRAYRGDSIDVTITLPGGAVVDVAGKVAWVNQGPSRPKPALPQGFGVEFRRVDAATSEALRAYVEAARGSSRVRTEQAYVVADYL